MQKDDTKGQDGTAADSSTKDGATSVSQHNAKPPVVGSPLLAHETTSQKILRQVREMMSAEPDWLEKRGKMFKRIASEFQ